MSDPELDVGRLLELAEREQRNVVPTPVHDLRATELRGGAVVLAFGLEPEKGEDDEVRRDPLAALTPGQRRVALAALDGCSDEEIARRLGLSRHTVGNQLRRGYQRLGINSRSELSALVRRRGEHDEE